MAKNDSDWCVRHGGCKIRAFAVACILGSIQVLNAQTTIPASEQGSYDITTGYGYDEDGDGEYPYFPLAPTYPPGDIEYSSEWESATSLIAEAKATRIALQHANLFLCVLVGMMFAHAALNKVRP